MDAESLRALAVSVLTREWAGYWAWILGAGALPTLTRRLAGWPRTAAAIARWHRYASLVALLGCLSAWRPLADTWRLESHAPDAIAFETCEVVQARQWGPVGRLRCASGQAFALRPSARPAPAPGARACLAYLPATRIVLAGREPEGCPDAPDAHTDISGVRKGQHSR